MPAVRHLGLHARELRGVGGDHELVGAQDVSLDALGLGHADHLVHGAVHRVNHGAHRSLGTLLAVARVAPREAAGEPAAVAAGSTEAREVFLDHQHVQ